MAEANKSQPDWKSRIKAELERDKKRTIILLVLLVAAGIFGGRLVVKAIPGRAAAAPEANALLPDKNDAAGDGWKPGSLGASVSTAVNARREEYLSSLDRTIVRDLFRPNPEVFPPVGGDADYGNVNFGHQGQSTGWFQQVDRWIGQRDRAQEDQVARARAIKAQAAALRLQTTMLGPSATALINGQVLREGDWINGFQIKSIASDFCVIVRDGVELKLRMGSSEDRPPKPGSTTRPAEKR